MSLLTPFYEPPVYLLFHHTQTLSTRGESRFKVRDSRDDSVYCLLYKRCKCSECEAKLFEKTVALIDRISCSLGKARLHLLKGLRLVRKIFLCSLDWLIGLSEDSEHVIIESHFTLMFINIGYLRHLVTYCFLGKPIFFNAL